MIPVLVIIELDGKMDWKPSPTNAPIIIEITDTAIAVCTRSVFFLITLSLSLEDFIEAILPLSDVCRLLVFPSEGFTFRGGGNEP